MTTWLRLMVALVLCSWVAHAEAGPSVIAFPLEVKRGSSSADATKELQKELRRLVAKIPGVVTPAFSEWDAAVVNLKRQDCEANDECLKQLAIVADTIYALYVSLDQDVSRSKVIASARIVRRDGKLMGEPGRQVHTLTLTRGGDSFEAVARVALAQLLTTMELAKLAPALPANETTPAPTVTEPVVKAPPTKSEPEPTPLVVEPAPQSSPLKGVGIGLLAGGGAVAIIGGFLAGTSAPPAYANGNLDPMYQASFGTMLTQNRVGWVMVGVGAALAVTGGILFAVAPKNAPAVAIVPTRDGFSASLSLRF